MSVIHMSQSVRGAIRNIRDYPLTGGWVSENGRTLTRHEYLEALFGELAKGHEVIPLSGEPCEGFDYSKGCPGHETEEVMRE
jgi:hypothetical protein